MQGWGFPLFHAGAANAANTYSRDFVDERAFDPSCYRRPRIEAAACKRAITNGLKEPIESMELQPGDDEQR